MGTSVLPHSTSSPLSLRPLLAISCALRVKGPQLPLAGDSSGAVHGYQAAPSVAATPRVAAETAADGKRSSAATGGQQDL